MTYSMKLWLPRLLGSCAASLAAAIVVGALTGALVYRQRLAELRASRHHMLDEVLDVKRRAIETWLKERTQDVSEFAAEPRLLASAGRLLAGDPVALRELEGRFRDGVARGFIVAARMTARDGRVLLAVGPQTISPRYVEIEAHAPSRDDLRLRLTFEMDPDLLFTIGFMPSYERGVSSLLISREAGGLYGLPGTDAPPALPAPGTIIDRALRGETRIDSAPGRDGGDWDAASRPVAGRDWLMMMRTNLSESRSLALQRAVLSGGAAGAIILLICAGMKLLRQRAGDAKRLSDEKLALLSSAVERAAESVVITDAESHIVYVNPAFCQLTGYSQAEALGKTPRVLKSGRHDKSFYEEMWSVLRRGETWRGRLVNRRKDGTLFEEEGSIAPLRGPDGAVTHYIAVKRDVTAEADLERQLRQSQKMDAVGRLAGGVAHDFNNILTSILGNAEMTAMQAPAGSQLADDMQQIIKAGKLAADLTRQLLIFSRKQIVEPVALDMNQSLRDFEKMLRRTLGEDVKLVLELWTGPVWVKADPSQFDQVVLNLAVNARDAMPHGGRLSITASPVEFAGATTYAYTRIPAGQYARLRVTDAGVGMTPAIMDHLFEPFFTTKEKGRGTGLGLSTVFGIVKQAGGYITVDSEPGRGSTFSVYLPLVTAPDAVKNVVDSRSGVTRSGETVLLAEDQDAVRVVTERALRSAGYVVLPCRDGAEALAVEAAHRGDIHLLLTDVVMPGMGGRDLATRFQERRRGSRVLFMSGYTDEKLELGGALKPGVDLIQKPFTITALLARVRAALDRPSAAPGRI